MQSIRAAEVHAMDIIGSVKRNLVAVGCPDFIETNLGWVCIRNENIYLGPKYLAAVNYPPKIPNFEYVYKYSWRSNRDLVCKIYSSINGFNVFGSRFYVPGVRSGLTPESLLDYFNIPIDISVPSGHEFPIYAPTAGLVLGLSWRSHEGKNRKFHDILDEDGKIVSGFFDCSKEIFDVNYNFDEWIFQRMNQACDQFLSDAQDEGCLDKFSFLLDARS